MSVKHTGIGVVWGLTTTGVGRNGGTWTGSGVIRPTAQGVGSQARQEDDLDINGEPIGRVGFDFRKRLTLTVYPSGSSIANAVSSNILPLPLDQVQLVDPTDKDIDPATNGTNYICISASKDKRNDGKTTFTFELERMTDATGAAVTGILTSVS